MRRTGQFLVVSLFICTFILSVTVSNAKNSNVRHVSLTGNYLFDGKEISSVFYTIVYEEAGKLFARSELADYPVEMKKVKSSPPVYRIKFKSRGDFNLTFSRSEGGRYNVLSMSDNNSEFRMEGRRDDAIADKLRNYHSGPRSEYRYREPLALGDGLMTGSIYQTGVDTTALFAMMNDVISNYDYMHSILVIKDGKLVVEEYFNGWDPVLIHRLQSVTKSVTSTLVGLALQTGIINSVEDPVYEYLPQYGSLFVGGKRAIRIEDLLTMSAGFEWNEEATYYAAPEKCDAHIAEASGDFTKYVLEKPLVDEPGRVYEYNSGYPNILGQIITEQSGLNMLDFAFEHLFEPLGTERAQWLPIYSDKYHRPGCAGGLKITSRDMAKYGYLYLRDGVWNGTQVVSKEWVRESIEGKMDSGHNTRYGYLWKTTSSLDGRYDIFFASGTGGQYIACIPELDVVVVTTAKYNTAHSDKVAMLLLKQLLPALAGP